MRFIDAVDITTANTTTTVPLTDHAEYSASTTYATGDSCVVLAERKIYESLQDGNTGHAVTDEAWWSEVGAMNAWKAFDQYVNTQAENTNSVVYEVTPGVVVDSVALLAVDAQSVRVTCTDPVEGIVYQKERQTADLDVDDFYEYFFSPIRMIRDVHFLDLPPYIDAAVKVEVLNPGATAKVGVVKVGASKYVGATKWGPRISTANFGKWVTDSFGRTYYARGKYAKRGEMDVYVDNSSVDYVQWLLANINNTPVVWIGDERDKGFESLTMLAGYRDFDITIPGPSVSTCTIELEGVI